MKISRIGMIYHTQLMIQALLLLTLYMLNFPEGTKTSIYILSFLHNDRAQVVEILTQVDKKVPILLSQTMQGWIPGHRFQSPTPKPLGHKDTWTTQSLMVGWFITLCS